jgi:hypothetical protein
MLAEVGQGTSVKSSASLHFVTGRPVGLEQDLPPSTQKIASCHEHECAPTRLRLEQFQRTERYVHDLLDICVRWPVCLPAFFF